MHVYYKFIMNILHRFYVKVLTLSELMAMPPLAAVLRRWVPLVQWMYSARSAAPLTSHVRLIDPPGQPGGRVFRCGVRGKGGGLNIDQ